MRSSLHPVRPASEAYRRAEFAPRLRRRRNVEVLLLLATFTSFAYFNPGGGWNQNGRFAQIRALVEQGRFPIDSFAIYRVDRSDPSKRRLNRADVHGQEAVIKGVPYALAWTDASGKRIPLGGSSDLPKLALTSVAVSGDVAFVDGHLYPNKAPGTTLLAAPAYFLIHGIDQLAAVDPDDWRALTINSWMTSAWSVGLLSAIGCVLFFRTATLLSGGRERAALLATAGFAWGTLFFPYATMLYEHNVMAVAFLAAFWLLLVAAIEEEDTPSRSTSRRAFYAGACAGAGVAANYIGLSVTVLLGTYAFYRLGTRRAGIFAAGTALPLAAIALYDLVCFGAPWRISYGSQNPIFQVKGLFLGVFGPPRAGVLAAVLFSPFRGLFYTSPVLLAGVVGWFVLYRAGRFRAEAILSATVFLAFLAFNTCFHYWEGGWAPGPRYLVPALPFVAFPLAVAFGRFGLATSVLAILSVSIMLIVTAVDPQAPVLLRDPLWRYDPLLHYELPLFVENTGPVAAAEAQSDLIVYQRGLGASGVGAEERGHLVDKAKRDLIEAFRRRDTRLFPAATREGPVSANPMGIYEPEAYTLFPPGSVPAAWNSFNAGEVLFPKSRLSLLPLLVVSGGLFFASVRACGRRARS